MRKRMVGITAAAAGAVLVVGGTLTAFATTGGSGSETDGPGDSSSAITGAALDQATAAAVAAAGAGTVTESEAGGDEAAYEIELKLDSGGSVDVRLDDNFKVINVTPNSEKGDRDGGTADHATQQNEGPQGDGDGEVADD
jgi:hypothetical protein